MVLKNSIVMDIDGVICPIKEPSESYENLVPNSKVVEKMKEWRSKGFNIVLSTSRNMKTFQNNIGMINKQTVPTLIDWLNKWEIPFDELYVGKPWPGPEGFYVDDRSVRPNEFINMSAEELNSLMQNGRSNLV